MRRRALLLAVLGTLMTFALAGTASADVTLGSTTPPAGATVDNSCNGNTGVTIAQIQSDPATPDTVPAAGGRITQWSTNVGTGDTAGQQLTFVVLRPSGAAYTVVGTDSEALPNPLTPNSVATFTLAHPIDVNGGDVLGLWFAGPATCGFQSAPADDVLAQLTTGSPPPTTGESLPSLATEPTILLDLSANLAPGFEDAAVTASGWSGAAVGHPALLASTVTNDGPAAAPITFTDVVPAGLTINSASAGDGTCSTLGQNVTCTITGLAAGQSVPVNVVVTPSAPGSYTSHVSVAVPSTNPDPNSANNAASLTLAVEQVVPARCVVPKLKEVSAGLAKSVLKDLGCKVKLKHQRSGVHKGDVIGTSPGPGTHAYLAKVTVKVSSGKKH